MALNTLRKHTKTVNFSSLMVSRDRLKKFFQFSFPKLRAKMPKDDDNVHLARNGRRHGSKKVTFALNDIHHELSDGEDDEEEQTRPMRKTVPSYILGHPLADYEATGENVSMQSFFDF